MTHTGRYLIAAVACVIVSSTASGELAPTVTHIEPPEDILFVGNSFTYYNNSVHKHLLGLVRAAGGEPGVTRIMTISGSRLEAHTAGLATQLDGRDWDVVVLQGHSREPIEEGRVDGFRRAVRAHSAAIGEHGADTVLFMTWSLADRPQDQGPLSASYTAIGNETASLVVPVGLAFERSDRSDNGIELRISDGRHPSLAGTYLAACSFYAALFGRSPVGLDYDAGLDEDVSATLQEIAWQTVTEYYSVAP